MAKRFTDTEKFKDKWYRRLTPVLKCLWEYLISECNHAGVLEIDLEAMSFHIGAEISLKDLKNFDDRIFFISDDLIFIPKFISFQYGELNPENKVHRSVLDILNKYNLDPSKPLASTLLGTKDKDKESVKESDKESGGIIRGDFSEPKTDPLKIPVQRKPREKFQKPTVEEIKIYCSERKNNINPEQFYNFYESKGWVVGKTPMKNWKAAIGTWEQKDKKQGDNYDPNDKYGGYRLPG